MRERFARVEHVLAKSNLAGPSAHVAYFGEHRTHHGLQFGLSRVSQWIENV
jgi:hypothetical protein